MQLEEILKEIGLKEYEIKAYESLLFLISATPREISKEAKIPQTRVYDVLEELRKKGIVSISPGKPIRYNLVPVEVGLLPFIKSNQKKWKEMEEEIKNLSSDISKKTEGYSTKITLFQGWNVIKKIILDDIRSSEKEILRFLRFGKIDEEIFSEMENAIDRGVEIKIIGPYKKERELTIEKYKKIGCKVALIEADPPLVKENIFDEKILHVDFSEPEANKYITPKGTLLVRVSDPVTTKIFKEKFNLLFKKLKH